MQLGNDRQPTLHLLKGDSELEKPPENISEEDDSPEDERAVLCAACESEVTRSKWASKIGAKHEHVFVNPAGILYRIRCFSGASGIQTHGEYTDEWSWFPGYDWCYATCSSCSAHLGWHYAGEFDFFGLIADRIIEAE